MSAKPDNTPMPPTTGTITGTWSTCQFIENEGFKGGAAYFSSIGLIEIRDSLFVANHAAEGGGGLCISDPKEFGDTVVRICNTDFIANTAIMQGGAVYNRQASKTTLVNCILAGNTTNKTGGASCNADDGTIPGLALTELNMHNCLIAGNEAVTSGADGGGCYNRDGGFSEMINCTVVKNEAEDQFGGAANTTDGGGGAELQVRNCILWDNDDGDGGTDDLDAQLFYTSGTLLDENVDKNVIYNLGLDPDRFEVPFGQPEENKADDPDVINTEAISWEDCIFDPNTGTVAFELADAGNAAAGLLFQPDNGSPLQLLIKQVNFSIPGGNDEIVCYGWWPTPHVGEGGSGTIFDYHIAMGSSAINYGDFSHTPLDDCDLDPGTRLDVDLDLVDRAENPDSGAYEDN